MSTNEDRAEHPATPAEVELCPDCGHGTSDGRLACGPDCGQGRAPAEPDAGDVGEDRAEVGLGGAEWGTLMHEAYATGGDLKSAVERILAVRHAALLAEVEGLRRERDEATGPTWEAASLQGVAAHATSRAEAAESAHGTALVQLAATLARAEASEAREADLRAERAATVEQWKDAAMRFCYDYHAERNKRIDAEAREAGSRAKVERVEAEMSRWEGWSRVKSTPRIDTFRDAAEYLRAALGGEHE